MRTSPSKPYRSPEVRIVGGIWRGRALNAPGRIKGVRPTADRIREALFSILISSGWRPEGCHVLDLFAGTGAVGLEALSRGAASATFVEQDAQVRGLLRRNLAFFEEADARVLPLDATRMPANTGPRCGLVYVDPPYGKGLAEAALSSAMKSGWIAPQAIVIAEENTQVFWPDGLRETDMRAYSDTKLHFAQAA